MVYLYAKKRGEHTYYYLRASAKKDGKLITQDIAYLGTDPEQLQARLDQLPATYKQQIRKSYKTLKRFIQTNHYLQLAQEEKRRQDPYLEDEQAPLEACKLHWDRIFKQLAPETQAEQLEHFIIGFAQGTTALEGNTITLQQAEKLLMQGRTPKNKTLREIHDLQNTKKLFERIYREPVAITHESIQQAHQALLAGIDNRTGYRTQDIHVYKSHFDPTPAPYVKTDMDLLLDWLASADLHRFVKAIIFHHKFEKIHPFMDGNGRTGRLLANNLLLQAGYPPLLITPKHRERYLTALGKADKSSLDQATPEDYRALVQFAAKTYTENYWNNFL